MAIIIFVSVYVCAMLCGGNQHIHITYGFSFVSLLQLIMKRMFFHLSTFIYDNLCSYKLTISSSIPFFFRSVFVCIIISHQFQRFKRIPCIKSNIRLMFTIRLNVKHENFIYLFSFCIQKNVMFCVPPLSNRNMSEKWLIHKCVFVCTSV